ncbi:hypothetical protein AM493_15115 [Flavobacterium akiainvivens]|uniref:Uncharacterized protein n=1 Tax=Flavobacterium akiainvivens TaxID=1202724 RepID=A0A0M9VIY4_9FLAO|nr:hypothetical protein [Flavobacterium akiainvivens]KOS07216.1 hypothetical protein AM493_15115 [Flavobacterium akiainvivens]SFQ45163.1 hypothetical protein SAMN05444144_1053 [Flavobacterium akiainvivens]
MSKLKLIIDLDLPIKELIEVIKLQGDVIETEENIFGVSNNKYVDRRIIYYDKVFWVIYSILDNYEDKCYWEDMEGYSSEQLALIGYNELKKTLG